MHNLIADAGVQAHFIGVTLSRPRWQAAEARRLVELAEERGSPKIARMRGLVREIEDAAARTQAVWERIVAVANDHDPGLIEDAGGISITHKHGSNPVLAEKIRAIYAEDAARTNADKPFERLQRLAWMTFLQAAEEVLRSEMRPLSAEEITDLALGRGLLQTASKTPAATMSSALYKAPADGPIRHEFRSSRVRRSPGLARWLYVGKGG
jgi:hypothetical protein